MASIRIGLSVTLLLTVLLLGLAPVIMAADYHIALGETRELPSGTFGQGTTGHSADMSYKYGWDLTNKWELYVGTGVLAGVARPKEETICEIGCTFQIHGAGDGPISTVLTGVISWDGWLEVGPGLMSNSASINIYVNILDTETVKIVASQRVHSRAADGAWIDNVLVHDVGAAGVNISAMLYRGREYELRISAVSTCNVGSGIGVMSSFTPAICPGPGCDDNSIRAEGLSLYVSRDLGAEIDELRALVSALQAKFDEHTHTYLTGKGSGHNNVAASTTTPVSGDDADDFTTSKYNDDVTVARGITYLDDELLPTSATDGNAEVLYTLAEATQVKITIYDVTGRLVQCLVEQWQPAGKHSVRWDGRDDDGRSVSAGVYFAHLNLNGSDVDSGKIVIVK